MSNEAGKHKPNLTSLLLDGFRKLHKLPGENFVGNPKIVSHEDIIAYVKSFEDTMESLPLFPLRGMIMYSDNALKDNAGKERLFNENCRGHNNPLLGALSVDIMHLLSRDAQIALSLLESNKSVNDRMETRPTWWSKIERYLGYANKNERVANTILQGFNKKVSHYTSLLTQISALPNPSFNEKTGFSMFLFQINNLFVDDNTGTSNLPVFRNTNKLYGKLAELNKGFTEQNKQFANDDKVTAKPAKDNSMDFVSLCKHYTEFYSAIGATPNVQQIHKMSAILSSTDLRDIFGLKAIKYNPATLTTKIDSVIKSEGFNKGYYQKKLGEAIKAGIAMLTPTRNDNPTNDFAVMKR